VQIIATPVAGEERGTSVPQVELRGGDFLSLLHHVFSGAGVALVAIAVTTILFYGVWRWSAQSAQPATTLTRLAHETRVLAEGARPSLAAKLDSLVLLAASDAARRERARSTRQVGLALLACILLEVGALTFLVRRMRRQLMQQAQALLSRAGELRLHATRLQDQTTMLQNHASEAESLSAELEQTNLRLSRALEAAERARAAADTAMRQRAELEGQLVQAQRMEAVGQLAGGVAHDFNNVLTVIKSYSALALRSVSAAQPLRAEIKEIDEAADRAAALTRQLLAFSRRQMLEPRPILLNEVIAGLERLMRRLIGVDIELVTRPDPDLWLVSADPGQIEQVLMNLVVNARDAMPNGGRVEIVTASVELSADDLRTHAGLLPGRYVMLAISDNGTGISPEIQSRIFEPFFTTKEPGRGTGLGLSTVFGIVRQSGGDVWLDSTPGAGATFRVFLPALADETCVPIPEVREQSVVSAAGTETILVVEDDASIRTLTARVLREQGYRVLEAADGLEALEVASRHAGRIDLVVSDVVMPGMGGVPLVERLSRSRPAAKILFISGYSDDEAMRRGMLRARAAFLAKPFTPETIARRVREVLDSMR
jgi:signal transduction histidine kinase/ActR/RegA family two-component response regulator